MQTPVDIQVSEGIVQITLNRPERRNALSFEMAHTVSETLDELDARSDLQVAIITGAGGCFSSGMDIKDFAESGRRPSLPGRGVLGLGEHSRRKPIIAAVEGLAFGGGWEVALACDLVIAGESARFALPEVKRGLVAGGGGLVRLAQRIPYALAMEITLTGSPISAARCAQLGLINRVVADGSALESARLLAGEICENAPLAIQLSKNIVRAARTWTTNEVLAPQAGLLRLLEGSPDVQEGARAFLEKRPPNWTGR